MSDKGNESDPASDLVGGATADPGAAAAERPKLDSELLRALAASVDRNEGVQERFRNAVVRKLARLEARARVLQADQFVDPLKCCSVDRGAEQIEACEAIISELSEEIERKMFKEIFVERGAESARRGRPLRWSGWDI